MDKLILSVAISTCKGCKRPGINTVGRQHSAQPYEYPCRGRPLYLYLSGDPGLTKFKVLHRRVRIGIMFFLFKILVAAETEYRARHIHAFLKRHASFQGGSISRNIKFTLIEVANISKNQGRLLSGNHSSNQL